MTDIVQPDNDLSDNLPLLTQVVEEEALDDIPTLTEIVAETDSNDRQFTPLAVQENMADTTEAVVESPVASDQETGATKNVIADDDLLSLLEFVETEMPRRNDGTTGISTTPEAALSPPRAFNDEEMQHLLHQLETHIETVLKEKLSLDTIFTKKLTQQLEQLQQMAITQAVDELKAELPEILHNALNARTKL